MSDYIPVELRRFVTKRANDCCEYCRTQARFSADSLTLDHIHPRSLGGTNEAENLALSCFGCNQHKADRITGLDPIGEKTVPLFHPRQQIWDDHFSWNNDFTLIVGLTTIGRATIETLHLNRIGLVNLRRVLFSIGEHPPKIM